MAVTHFDNAPTTATGIRTGNLILVKRGDQLSLYAKCLGLYSWLRGKLFTRSDYGIATRYRGMAWCDSTEHQLSNEIMTGRSNRL